MSAKWPQFPGWTATGWTTQKWTGLQQGLDKRSNKGNVTPVDQFPKSSPPLKCTGSPLTSPTPSGVVTANPRGRAPPLWGSGQSGKGLGFGSKRGHHVTAVIRLKVRLSRTLYKHVKIKQTYTQRVCSWILTFRQAHRVTSERNETLTRSTFNLQ